MQEPREHEIDLGEPPDLVMAAVARAAEAWGAELERQERGGLLHLPFVAGLRRGLVSGPLSVEAIPEGSRVIFRAEESRHYVHTASVAVLLLAGAGGLLTVLWPFFPQLLPVAPFGAIFALGGWFLVISRLRTSGPDEFLAAVAAEAGGAPPA
jgi:uncharacterized BrkB/YihY/UPF0761 family membrane protein